MPCRLALLLAFTLVATACTTGGDQPPSDRKAGPATATAAPPPPEGAIPATFFGMHDHDPIGDSWPKASIGSLRAWDCGVMWREIETSPGVYSFERLDAIVATAEKHKADVLVVLGQTPAFHALRPKANSFYGPGASSPPNLEAWTAYVRALAERYAGRPVHYQVWNEANVKGFWRGTPADLAALTQAARDVLATINPRPTLVAPGFATRLTGQRAWIDSYYGEAVAGAPVADLVDAVALHLYPPADGTVESSMQLLETVKAALQARGVDKPIWNTEINYGVSGTEVEPASEAQQQANVAQTLLRNAAAGIERVYWYGWDQQSIVDTRLTDGATARASAAGRAYRRTQQVLGDSALDTCARDAAGTTVCLLRRADSKIQVYWNEAAPVVLQLPGDALAVHTLAGGSVTALSRSVVLGPLPLAVIERG